MTLQASASPGSSSAGDEQSPLAVTDPHDWRAAARLLLDSVGFHDPIEHCASPRELATFLRGQGFDLIPVTIINQTVPPQDNMLGYLLEFHDGGWAAVRGHNEDAVLLSASGSMPGSPSGAHEAIPMDAVTGVWVLTERLIALNAMAPFIRRYKAHFIDLFVAAIVVNLFALVLPLFSSFVYDKILGNGILETLWALVIGIMIVIGIEFCVRLIRVTTAERFAIGSEVDIDHATFRNLLDTRGNKMPTLGGLLEKYKQILSYRDFLSSSYLLAVADLPFLILFLGAIAVVAGPLVFVSLVCGGLMLLTSVFLTSPVLDYDRVARGAGERRFGLITDFLVAREAIIGSALRNRLAERWRHASVTAVQAASKSRYWRALGQTVSNSVSYISFVGVLAGGVYMVEAHQLTSGGLLAASMLTSRCMGTFGSVITLTTRYREFGTALRELNQLVPAKAHAAGDVRHHGKLQGAVRFDKVTCRLRADDAPVLQNISLHINPGEIVGIAGAPGAGKTTLLRLLAGILDPDEGKILIDNIPLTQLSPEDISMNIGFKPQDFCLLDGTIEDNVRAGRAPLSAEKRQDVLTTSGLLRAFREGVLHWTTDIGPRGTCLSGGQRQLVSLARAFLERPSLMLLDEPTNGLDQTSENYLAEQLMQMRGQSTILVSTHSRAMLSICDRIIVVGQSTILANGPRDKILVG
jgi:ABC-type bacteriocin/lantibiotic exporter with double-glycine peptidase domain